MTTTPAEKPPQLLGRPTTHVFSSVIARLRQEPGGAPHTLCADCPAAMWVVEGKPRCFCGAMKEVTWTTESATPITQCDARETAVANFQEAKKQLPEA